ncbi:MAG: hypothetical protein MUE81_23770, partial [Thermoflexibacter sp.]|nr:hypothetical protein [Thermoflexibacter sp.]
MAKRNIFNKLRQFFIAFGLFIISVLAGMIGFQITEGYGAIDAFYMTMMIVSTTGMNEVKQLSMEGR